MHDFVLLTPKVFNFKVIPGTIKSIMFSLLLQMFKNCQKQSNSYNYKKHEVKI